MEYLQKVLGLKLTYINDDIKHIPNFIGTRYVLRNVLLDRQKAVFIYPKTELEQIETLKKTYFKDKKHSKFTCCYDSGRNHISSEGIFASGEDSICCK